MGFILSQMLFYVITFLWKQILKKSSLRWKLLPGSVHSQPSKTTKLKQKRKLPPKWQITVKSTPRRAHKTSLSITTPLVLPFFTTPLVLLNYEEPMTKNVGIQTDHDYSLYYSDYCKNNNFGNENPGMFNTDPRVKKRKCSLDTTVKEFKTKKFSIEKINEPNAVRFHTNKENYDALIAVFMFWAKT